MYIDVCMFVYLCVAIPKLSELKFLHPSLRKAEGTSPVLSEAGEADRQEDKILKLCPSSPTVKLIHNLLIHHHCLVVSSHELKNLYINILNS